MNTNSNNQPSSTTQGDLDKATRSSQDGLQGKEDASFVKLAMRNMVKKGGTSLFHFFLTIVGVFGALLGLAIVFH
ncbi:DUF3285 domain-containing protein [Pseudanabaena mucicola]|uniref:DUF3285 domain-containing protein n=1 Tax=Pseudanabaena mucicola FACHB-723 TaxID=2692860 RepID=A0ABR7ZT50_9CYAN|nr:DUF3285 domain-containing protein [Pseudanabaena mucicola]MBD2186880.1 DUF3285 domain-containing protein [Pseudanabaena mucicola FACHB-723]